MRLIYLLALAVVPASVVTTPVLAAPATASAQSVMDELLATDRAYSAKAGSGMIDAFAAMFDADLIIPQPGGKFLRGRDAAVAAIKGVPGNADARASWTPVRGGLSADGRHGFSYGYMTVTRADGSAVPVKYLTYWIKRADGWHAAAYKRAGRPAGEVPTALAPASLPARLVAPRDDVRLAARQRAELMAVENAFSDRAQRIGIGPAFAQTGRPDSMNMGGEAQFTIGSTAIAAGFDPGTTSPVVWNADHALVASSGDLGVTFGVIRQNAKPEAPGSAFFTIWRRDGGKGGWRYIAE